MKNTYQILRERIAELVPEVKELKFGCEVFVQNYVMSVTIIEDKRGRAYVPESEEPNTDFLGLANSLVYFNEKHIIKILGTPPTLADLLLAIQTKKYIDHSNNLSTLTLTYINDIHYDLSRPLFHQSEETLLALIKILK